MLICRGATEDWLNALLSSTAGIIFLGTPHAGARLAEWFSIITKVSQIVRPTNRPIVDVLRPGSEMLANVQQEFHRLLDQRQNRGESVPRIHCFFEELAFSQATGHIVPPESAILPRYGNEGIHANHVNMTKFEDRNDRGYQAIVGLLKIWSKEIEGADKGKKKSQLPDADPLTAHDSM
jgi:protein SERAC1